MLRSLPRSLLHRALGSVTISGIRYGHADEKECWGKSGREVRGQIQSAGAGASFGNSGDIGEDLSEGALRAASRERMAVAGGDHFVGAVYGRAGEYGDSCAVYEISDSGGAGEHGARSVGADDSQTGFFRNKAKSLVGAARKIIQDFHGQVPETMEELLSLPGVARKTANVVLGSWFGLGEGIVVDTHVQRISRRLELTTSDDPSQIERDLMKVIPQAKWIDFAHEVILHGRALCTARAPKCADCPLETLCHAADKTWSTVPQHKTAKAKKG